MTKVYLQEHTNQESLTVVLILITGYAERERVHHIVSACHTIVNTDYLQRQRETETERQTQYII